jgi:hypothetical protein
VADLKKEKRKRMKRIKVVLLSLLTIIGLTFAGYKIVEHSYVEKIVQSDEVKTIIESNLKQRHKGALEEGNIIQSYEIDKDSISLNPMGGIMFRVFINNNKEMYVNFLIDKDPRYDDGRLVNEGGGPSQEFKKLISGSGNE